jgi:isocitrate/isopropylmalate dehydrogenase
MTSLKVLVLPGDGIGPEIVGAAVLALTRLDETCGLGLAVDQADVGLSALAACGTTLPDAVWHKVRDADGIVLGPLSTYEYPPKEAGGVNPSAEFRTRLDLYANIRPSQTRPRPPSPARCMDLVLVRENTEGFYASRSMHQGGGEFMPDPDSAYALRKITRGASHRVARMAFELARTRRRKVMVVHKANVLKMSDGLFLRAVRETADSYQDVVLEEMLVDAAAAALVRQPGRFDVIVTTNMFGDILSNEAAELSGGLGLSPSLNVGESIAMAQASHGSAPDIAGTGGANPTGLMLSLAMLLDWLGRRHARADLVKAAKRLIEAIDHALADPTSRTRDLGGPLGTDQFARAVITAPGFAEPLPADRGRSDDEFRGRQMTTEPTSVASPVA